MRALGERLTTVPDGFNLNPKLVRQMEAKKEMFETGEGFDWATAEALAFGSLVSEGRPVAGLWPRNVFTAACDSLRSGERG